MSNRLTEASMVAVVSVLLLALGCGARSPAPGKTGGPGDSAAPGTAPGVLAPDSAEARYAMERRRLANYLRSRGIEDELVVSAISSVPRHLFVPVEVRGAAYEDRPLPIGADQTISQPYVVATMSEAARLTGSERVLEIGTGSGYQAAILSVLCKDVYSIEIIPELGRSARELLARLGYDNVHVRIGDGYAGAPDAAPFDAILITAAPERIPPVLVTQLAVGGRLIMPIGPEAGPQHLMRYIKRSDGTLSKEKLYDVMFVPMTGAVREEK